MGWVLLAAATVQTASADNLVAVPINFKATVSVQNSSTKAGTVETYLAPVKYALTTQGLSQRLFAAETALGFYNDASNIIGAKLVLVVDVESVDKSHFAAEFAGAEVCNFSNILQFTAGPSGVITGGKSDTSSLLMTKEKFTVPFKLTLMTGQRAEI